MTTRQTVPALARAAFLCSLAALAGTASAAPVAPQGNANGLQVVGPHAGQQDAKIHLRVGSVDPAAMGARALAQNLDAAGPQRLVVQLDGPMTKERMRALTDAGATVGSYIPDNAFIVKTADPAALQALDFVRWAGQYQNDWKVDPVLDGRQRVAQGVIEATVGVDLAAADARDEFVTVNISLFDDSNPDATARTLAAIEDLTVHAAGLNGKEPMVTATLPRNSLDLLAAHPEVRWVEAALVATERNIYSRSMVQSGTLNVTPLWDNGITGAGQVAAVIDGRVNPNHCSFSDTVPFGPAHRKILAFNSPGSSYSSHGTHVAGTIAGDAGVPGASTRGVAYDAKIIVNTQPGWLNGTDFYNRLQLHHNQGARIHTNSWGADFRTDYNAWTRAIDQFSRDNEDSLVAFAVTNQSVLYTPENAKSVLAVGATSKTGSGVESVCTGGRGPTADGRRKPEVFAPGCSIISSSNSSCGTYSESGTSMACPAVAGAAVLVRQYFTDGFYPTGEPVNESITPTGALLRAVMINASQNMTGVTGYPSNPEGWGRIIADNALYFPGDDAKILVRDIRNSSDDALSTGETYETTFSVDSDEPTLEITMAFTDVPASPGAAFAPVNDVDLVAISPSGVTFRGNYFNTSAGVSLPDGTADSINSIENIIVPGPETGTWTVRVIGTAVNQQTQGFALAITGGVAEASVVCIGDANGDGLVNFSDLNMILDQFGSTGPGFSGDLDGDESVGFSDLNLVLNNFATTCN